MLKVGTDFSGIGSPETALNRLNINYENVFACDIDKFAKLSYLQNHYPNKFYDDITTRDYSEVPQLDLYVAGFPCQSFSMAGRRGGFDDVRGTLFFNVAEFIKVNQPKCFILENVKGLLSHDKGRTFQTIIDLLSNGGGTINGQMLFDTIDDGLGYHIYYKVLNTKNYGIPQNRERIFIIGFKENLNTFIWKKFRFPRKVPLNKTLKDLLENEVNEKYYLSEKMINTIKRHCNKITKKETPNISCSIHANYFKMGGRDQQYVNVHSLYPRCGDPNKGGTGHLSKSDGTSYCLDTGNTQAIEQNKKIRRLTPLECWRLQGFTDEEFWKAQKVNSDTQLYKQAGNSITVNVMTEIFKKIYYDTSNY